MKSRYSESRYEPLNHNCSADIGRSCNSSSTPLIRADAALSMISDRPASSSCSTCRSSKDVWNTATLASTRPLGPASLRADLVGPRNLRIIGQQRGRLRSRLALPAAAFEAFRRARTYNIASSLARQSRAGLGSELAPALAGANVPELRTQRRHAKDEVGLRTEVQTFGPVAIVLVVVGVAAAHRQRQQCPSSPSSARHTRRNSW